MKYLPPFDLIKRSLDIKAVDGSLRINLSYDEFVNILRMMLQGVEVDEAWYKETYPDIGQAIDKGRVPSARHHFLNDGWLEGRLPYAMNVEEDWYLKQYPDVADFLRRGLLTSAQGHFDEDGYREGRLPYAV